MILPELTFHELYDLKKSCKYLFPEKRYSEIDDDFLECLNTDLLRRTYKKRIFDCHPDRLGAASASMARFKTKQCQQINEAYEKLKRFVQQRNEWIYTVLTSDNYAESRSGNAMPRRQSRHTLTTIFGRFKPYIHPPVNFFKGIFREMPRQSARYM